MSDAAPNPRSDVAYDVAMAVVYSIVIALNVYLIANELTDGALSSSLSTRMAYWRQRYSEWTNQRKTVRREYGKVLWEATNIVEGNEK